MAKTLGICGFIHRASGVNVCHYRDRIGLEFGVVLALKDGRYALVEAKFPDYQAKEARVRLRKTKKQTEECNAEVSGPYPKMALP